jgi:hypothetical protein
MIRIAWERRLTERTDFGRDRVTYCCELATPRPEVLSCCSRVPKNSSTVSFIRVSLTNLVGVEVEVQKASLGFEIKIEVSYSA